MLRQGREPRCLAIGKNAYEGAGAVIVRQGIIAGTRDRQRARYDRRIARLALVR